MNQPLPAISIVTTAARSDSSIGRVLLDMGKIKPEDTERILRQQKEKGLRFGEAAMSLGLITDDDIRQVLAQQFDYAYLQPGQGSFSPQLAAAYQPFSKQVETLRAVRSQLMLRWFANGRKTLAIASIHPGEGASLFAANLAVVFSQLGEHTLLVDANLRSPSQHQIFNLPGRQGLSDILAGRADLDAITGVDSLAGLSVLQAGTLPPNPQELVSRAGFDELARAAASRFDVVLFDMPAFSAGADALSVAMRAGGVVLVVRKNTTGLVEAGKAVEQFERAGAVVVGTVMVDY